MVFEVNFLPEAKEKSILRRIFLGEGSKKFAFAEINVNLALRKAFYCNVFLPTIFKKKTKYNNFEDNLVDALLHESLHAALLKFRSVFWRNENMVETLCQKIMEKEKEESK